MQLTNLKVDELGIINHIDTQDHNEIHLCELMKKGIVGGLEIRKISEVSTCAEYRIEGVSSRIVIDKCLSDYIFIDRLDEVD